MGAFVRYVCLVLVCLFVAGTTLHDVAMPMAADHADMAGGCADCAMPQDAALTCGDLCQVPPATLLGTTIFSTVAGRLPQRSAPGTLPEGRFGTPEPHPPKDSVTTT